jgi:CRISPR type III-A-associated protein Csm2
MADMADKLRAAGVRGYPQYFTKEGFLRTELLKEEAEQRAQDFHRRGLTRHQLRAFFDHAKKQLQRLQYGAPFREILPEIIRLKTAAADRAARTGPNRIPSDFRRFIDSNIDAITDQRSFERGFMPHFEALVAYFPRDERD